MDDIVVEVPLVEIVEGVAFFLRFETEDENAADDIMCCVLLLRRLLELYTLILLLLFIVFRLINAMEWNATEWN